MLMQLAKGVVFDSEEPNAEATKICSSSSIWFYTFDYVEGSVAIVAI